MTRVVLPAEPLRDGPTELRAWRDSDLPALTAALRDPEIIRWRPGRAGPVSHAPSDARAYLLHRYDMTHTGQAAPFAIVAAGDGPLLGSVSLLRISWAHRRAEIGYWLAGEARGRGHATRAVRLACAWGAEALSLERFDLRAAAGNEPSLRVAERAGFQREALLRSYMPILGGRRDMVAYGLLVGGG